MINHPGWILQVGIALEIMMLFLFFFCMIKFRMKLSDFTVIWLQEDWILQIGSNIHWDFVFQGVMIGQIDFTIIRLHPDWVFHIWSNIHGNLIFHGITSSRSWIVWTNVSSASEGNLFGILLLYWLLLVLFNRLLFRSRSNSFIIMGILSQKFPIIVISFER